MKPILISIFSICLLGMAPAIFAAEEEVGTNTFYGNSSSTLLITPSTEQSQEYSGAGSSESLHLPQISPYSACTKALNCLVGGTTESADNDRCSNAPKFSMNRDETDACAIVGFAVDVFALGGEAELVEYLNEQLDAQVDACTTDATIHSVIQDVCSNKQNLFKSALNSSACRHADTSVAHALECGAGLAGAGAGGNLHDINNHENRHLTKEGIHRFKMGLDETKQDAGSTSLGKDISDAF